MADVKKIATRESYGNALKELGAEHDDLLVFDADLAGSTKTGVFKKAYPDRHFNCGIAEGNMMAVAAGAASMGMVVFASSFAMFAAGRAFEQIRNSIGDPAAPLRVRQADGQHLPRPGGVPGIHPPAIHQDTIGQPLDPADYRSGQAQMPFQQGVHPDPRQLRPHRQLQTAAHRASSRVAKKK